MFRLLHIIEYKAEKLNRKARNDVFKTNPFHNALNSTLVWVDEDEFSSEKNENNNENK